MSARQPVAIILLIWCAGLGAAGQFAKVSFSFSQLAEIYPVSATQLGWVVSVVSLLGMVLGLTAGQLVGAFGFRRVLIWAIFSGAALSALQALFPPFEILIALRILEGLTHLAMTVAAPTLIGVLAAPAHRSIFMALWSTFFSVTFALVAWFAPSLMQQFGTGSLYLGHALYMVVIGLILWIWLPRGTIPRTTVRPSLSELLARHLRCYRSPTEFAPALGWLFYTLTFAATLTLIPEFMTVSQHSKLLPLMPLASITGSLTLGAYLLRKMPATTLVQIGFFCALVCSAVLHAGLTHSEILLEWGITSSGVYLALFGALGLVQAASFAAIPQLNPAPDAQALAHGGMSQMGNLGNLIGTPIMIVAISAMDYRGFTVMLMICYAGGIVAHAAFAYQRRNRS